MALQAAVQRRTGQARDGGLQGMEAVIERQQCVLAEGDHDRLFGFAQYGRSGRLRPHRRVVGRAPALPFDDGLRIDPMAAGRRTAGGGKG